MDRFILLARHDDRQPLRLFLCAQPVCLEQTTWSSRPAPKQLAVGQQRPFLWKWQQCRTPLCGSSGTSTACPVEICATPFLSSVRRRVGANSLRN